MICGDINGAKIEGECTTANLPLSNDIMIAGGKLTVIFKHP